MHQDIFDTANHIEALPFPLRKHAFDIQGRVLKGENVDCAAELDECFERYEQEILNIEKRYEQEIIKIKEKT